MIIKVTRQNRDGVRSKALLGIRSIRLVSEVDNQDCTAVELHGNDFTIWVVESVSEIEALIIGATHGP